MNYIELLNRFWGMNGDFSDREKLLYFYLLHRCNELGWPETFSLSNEEIVGALKCRPTIMKEARKALVSAGLIVFSAGNGRGNNSFFSIVAEKGRNGNPFMKKGSVSEPLYEEKKGRNGNPFISSNSSESSKKDFENNKKGSEWEPLYAQVQKEEKNEEKKSIPPAPPLKEKKKEKKKDVTHNLNDYATPTSKARVRTHENEDGQMEIVFKEVEPKPLKKKREPVEPVLPEDIQEVISFFEKYGQSLQDWRTEAEAFYYHYDSLGWMGTSNRKIQNWKSKARLWIADQTVKEKQKSVNNATTTINPTSSTRESRLAEAAELVDSLLREGGIG
jgi:hypothetical protein